LDQALLSFFILGALASLREEKTKMIEFLLPVLKLLERSNATSRNPQPATRNPQHATRNPQPATRNPQPVTRNAQPATRNPKPATRNPNSALRYPLAFQRRLPY